MLKALFRVWLLATAILMGASAPTIAHQQKAAITKVLFNPRTGNIEVMHRFYLHDAEHAVRQIFGKSADIISSTETQSLFADYVSERFAMTDDGVTPLPLTPVGFEIERRFFWVYQETPVREGIEELTFRHDALRDLWPEQINTINVEGLGDIRTATLEGSVEVASVTLDPPKN
ncbi:MAG: hypothetical protein JJ850_16870 [Kordiimonadaceae bacterium]|nr:hypothetical protein [Kordiimonadaceae bacterium]MBO6569764.1 hypothetical protein [Kordiimonadaceae bacterium]MBO6966299.1 hypothetical protein [Kordiimonadaceae bacterium]